MSTILLNRAPIRIFVPIVSKNFQWIYAIILTLESHLPITSILSTYFISQRGKENADFSSVSCFSGLERFRPGTIGPMSGLKSAFLFSSSLFDDKLKKLIERCLEIELETTFLNIFCLSVLNPWLRFGMHKSDYNWRNWGQLLPLSFLPNWFRSRNTKVLSIIIHERRRWYRVLNIYTVYSGPGTQRISKMANLYSIYINESQLVYFTAILRGSIGIAQWCDWCRSSAIVC